MKTPTPRVSSYFGQLREGTQLGASWIEDETLCYPDGNMTRRAYARCPDGKLRVVRCGIPDTFFSIPCRGGGYLSSEENGGEFTYHPPQKNMHKFFRPVKKFRGEKWMRDCDVYEYPVTCSNTSTLGFDKIKAQRGDIVCWADGDQGTHIGRMVGVVHAKAFGDEAPAIAGHLLVLALNQCLTYAHLAWIDPTDVRQVVSCQHKNFLAKFFGNEPLTFTDLEQAQEHYFSASHMDGRN